MTPKPLKKHRVQWSDSKKVVNGDGQRGENHRKTIDANGSRGKKNTVSHRSQKMTIVHL